MDEHKVAVLRHYASPYYDPQKAHEYYMRTRELKGRRSEERRVGKECRSRRSPDH